MKKVLAALFLAIMMSPTFAAYTPADWENVEMDGNFYAADC